MNLRRHKRRPHLDPKMEAVLVRLLEQVGELYKTQAVKLPYLVDVVAFHVLGHPITRGSYKSWDHGVVEQRVYDLVTSARHGGAPLEKSPFQVEEPPGYEDRQILKLKRRARVEALAEEEEEIVDFVAAQYAGLRPAELGRLTKKMNPHIPIRQWPSGKGIHVDEIAYEQLPVGWDEVDAAIARERIEEIERDPSSLVAGDDLLDEILG